MARVEIEHLEKVYPNGAHAVADVSLQVADGELLALVGPSGCGKSTLLRLVAGLEDATAGTIRIGDAVANALSPRARNVAMVFQDYALYPHLTVRGNLEFPLRMRKMPSDEMGRRVEWVAGLLDLAALLDRVPRQLSGGQRQRVAMGRALVREPTVSLLDEPLSNLDARLRVQVRAEIGELQRRTRTTMIYVTHDQVEAMTLGDRVAVMNEGRLQQVAPPQELYDRPATVFVAGFTGNPPMNLFPTRVTTDEQGGESITVGPRRLPLRLARGRADFSRGRSQARLTAGLRPEALALAADGDRDALETVVEHVEWLGHETLAHVSSDGIRLVARLPGMHMLRRGETVRLRVDAERLHLFGEDGRALGSAD